MAFNGSTNNLERPKGLRDILAPRLPKNTNGFQGAHIIGSDFWLRSLQWLRQLGFQDNQDTLNNGVLLPESARGNLVLDISLPTGGVN